MLENNNSAFFEISAKSGFNVDELFDTLIREIYKDIKALESSKISRTNTGKTFQATTTKTTSSGKTIMKESATWWNCSIF